VARAGFRGGKNLGSSQRKRLEGAGDAKCYQLGPGSRTVSKSRRAGEKELPYAGTARIQIKKSATMRKGKTKPAEEL